MKKLMALLAVCLGSTAVAQNSTFTYQGRLIDNYTGASGAYDFRFSLFDASTNGNSVGYALTNSAVVVSNGLFTTLLDFGNSAFDGSGRWLEIGVRSNGSAGAFTTILPRQAMTASPYALRALNATSVSNGVYTSANQIFAGVNQFTNTANTFAGNGGGLTNVNAAKFNGLSLSSFWQTSGNSNTVAGTQFLGTTDNQALELKVNGARALRLEPAAVPNLIGGASGNSVSGSGIVIGGGTLNKVQSANYSVISGGETNQIQSGSDHSFIGGGNNNRIQAGAYYSVIAGGTDNDIQGGSANATIGGGTDNSVRAFSSTIAGGGSNLIETNAYGSTIAGGVFNTIQTNANYSAIAGGLNNTIGNGAANSMIVGGNQNTIGTNASYSLAAGRRARAIHPGSFVWADGNNLDFASTATNSFSVRATGGVRFVSAIDGSGIPTNGVSLAAGSGSWSTMSDRQSKENFTPVDSRKILNALAELPLSTWNYKTQDKAVRHVGPMAQDFAEAFQVGEDNRHISNVDEEGIALAAIQGLNQVVREKDAEIKALKVRNELIEKRLSDLEQLLKSPGH